jgi:hypothetical protein
MPEIKVTKKVMKEMDRLNLKYVDLTDPDEKLTKILFREICNLDEIDEHEIDEIIRGVKKLKQGEFLNVDIRSGRDNRDHRSYEYWGCDIRKNSEDYDNNYISYEKVKKEI